MNSNNAYPIGTPGKKWGDDERAAWLGAQSVNRLYAEEVLPQIEALRSDFEVASYGALLIDPERYPLLAVKTRDWNPDLPAVLITGGVHGYETSGVQGALRFLQTGARTFVRQFNFVVMPCVSPWGYETINRWNSNGVDPNRSFRADSPSEEAAAVMRYLESLGVEFIATYVTTTEMYPDSPNATDEICIEAQVAAITGGLDYVVQQRN